MHCLLTDKWTNLPSISEPRSSIGLCTFEEEYLYAFGGMWKSETSSPILNIIERLNFKNKMYWEKVHLILPYPVWDIGLIQVGPNQIVGVYLKNISFEN